VTAVIPLEPIHNPDPFRPAFSATAAAPPPPPKPAPAPKPVEKAVKVAERPMPPPGLVDNFNGPALDAVPMGFRQPVGPPAGLPEPPPKPTAAPKPVRKPAPAPEPKPNPPAVVVTGILEGDENVAILRWSDTQRQVVRVGDRLEGGFTVKEIRSDAVLVTHGKHQWWIRIGS
jgi:hypothetical protein